MLIHSFIENAIKHGISHLEGEGKIEISTQVVDRSCIVKIKDNGIGREKSVQMTKLNTGMGLFIIDRIIENYNNLEKTNIRYHINDLKNENGIALGTEIIINIPL